MLVCVPATKNLRLAVRWKQPRRICVRALQSVATYLANADEARMSQVVDDIRGQFERASSEMSMQRVLPVYDFDDWDRTRGCSGFAPSVSSSAASVLK